MRGGAILPILVTGVTPLALLALIIIGSTLALVAWEPPVLWTDQIGSPTLASGLIGIAAGNSSVSVAGFLDTYRMAGGNPFIRNYSPEGGITWTSKMQDPQFSIEGITTRSDGIYLVGAGSSNTSLLKYNYSGNQLWSKIVVSDTWSAVVSANSFGIFVASSSYSPVTNQTFTGRVLFVREYDPNGGIVWTNEFSNDSSDVIWGISASSSRVYVVTETSLVAYGLNGVELWSHSSATVGIYPFSVCSDATGAYVSGVVPYPTGFVEKFDANGNLVWNTAFESPDQGGIGFTSVSAGSSAIYLSMVSIRGNDFIKKFDAGGGQAWSFQAPMKPSDSGASDGFLVAATSGGFYLGGTVSVSSGVEGLVQAFPSSPSLLFFGINPPYSFVVLGAIISTIVLSVFLLRRMLSKRKFNRPKSMSPDRIKRPGDTLGGHSENIQSLQS